MITEVRSQSPAETFGIGEDIGRRLKGNEIILLKGDLGAGKTLITKGIAQSLGIDPEEVVSPTFTLVNEFRGRNNIKLIHMDLYRLGPSVMGNLPEIDDHIGDCVIIIEWAQYLGSSYFGLNHSITIDFQLIPEDENARILKIIEIN